jgi:hypothetical protein
VNRKGVCYDVGTVFSGFPWRVHTRPVLDAQTIRRELEIIRDGLHCNAVRITGHDTGRLVAAAETALDLGLEVWLSPAQHDKSPDQTLEYYLAAARAAEKLRTRSGGRPTPRDGAAPAGRTATGSEAAPRDTAGPAGEAGAGDCDGPVPGENHSAARCATCPGALCRRIFPVAGPPVTSQIVFCLGGELSLFMRGIVSGRSVAERMTNLISQAKAGSTAHTGLLNDFLGRASERVRQVFGGPLSYASLAGERVDWAPFDFVGVDHYRDVRIKDQYADMLQPFFGSGKPVVVTEVGMRGYRGADDSGTIGFGVVDYRSQVLHQLPLLGRLVRTRLNGEYVRDEPLQARELTEVLGILGSTGVDGVFVSSFVEPLHPFSEDPRHDLDMSALSLVKSYTAGRGSTYPDMPWEPKQAFAAVARHFAGR